MSIFCISCIVDFIPQNNDNGKCMNTPVVLKTLQWYPHNRQNLERLIAENAFAGNYAVFDWDFTCIFYDTQDNLFVYQLEQLRFNLSPKEFSKTIRAGIAQDTLLPDTINADGKALSAAELSEDLDGLYAFLYAEYAGLGGTKPLATVTATAEYRSFKAKMLVLMEGVHRLCGVDLCQLVSTGMTVPELETLAEAAIDKALTDEIRCYKITSDKTLPGKTGVVTGRYRKGIRLQPEMQNLLHVLNENGIETYICSASQEVPVRVFACSEKYAYRLKPELVYGRRRLLNTDGTFTAENDTAIPPTRREGKAEAICRLMQPKHRGKPPILIAGDSDGDFFMMDAFKDSAVLLIFDRGFDASAKIFEFIQRGLIERNTANASILVQRRNPQTGLFDGVL